MQNLQWYPGHMAKTRRLIEANLKLIDVVVEILDARIPFSGRNPHFDDIIKNKPRLLVLNKADLADIGELYSTYKKVGFETVIASGKTGEGVGEIKKLLEGKTCAFTGNSGVGKSTLLNRIDPDLSIKTAEISQKLGRGKHTTRECTLHKLEGGYVADTPEFASLEILKNEVIMKEDLPDCFPEFHEYIENCRFYPNCAHMDDKDCAVRTAVLDGEVPKTRYESYRTKYNELKDLKTRQYK